MRKLMPKNFENATFEDIHFTIPHHDSICLYLSSGISHIEYILNLENDFFIFNDNFNFYSREYFNSFREINIQRVWNTILDKFVNIKDEIELIELNQYFIHFKYQHKHAVFFFDDNNVIVQRMINAQLTLATLIGINDGCNEGGNYECINRERFLLALSPLIDQHIAYIIDHSYLLERTVYARGCSPNPKFQRHVEIRGGKNSNARSLSFDLQAVLVYVDNIAEPNNSTAEQGKVSKRELIIFPVEDSPTTQLALLKPLRERYRTSRLAEYVVKKNG